MAKRKGVETKAALLQQHFKGDLKKVDAARVGRHVVGAREHILADAVAAGTHHPEGAVTGQAVADGDGVDPLRIAPVVAQLRAAGDRRCGAVGQ